MDKNIIRQYLNKTFLSEETTPAEKLGNQISSKNKKANKDGIGAVAKDMGKYEKSLTKPDSGSKGMAQNKFNYTDKNEETYHDEMEIMNGQEMIKYDRNPDKVFKERAIEAIEGSSRMGNNSEWANVVPEQQGFTGPEFGKKLVKKIKDSEKKRNEQTPTTKMFGDDWEVTKDKGNKPYAFESVMYGGSDGDYDADRETEKMVYKYYDNGQKEFNIGNVKLAQKYRELALKTGSYLGFGETDLPAYKSQDNQQSDISGDDFEKLNRQIQYGITPYNENMNKKQQQIKETMKRLKFKKEFNGVGNAIKMIPESYRVDNKVFEMTDGNESYKVRWEGSLTEGKAIVLMASDKKIINEDIQKMKHLMGYKSEKTLGTVKGKDRITENDAFADIFNKTKKLLEMEDIDGQDAEKEAQFDDADISHAPEAKKHIEGSVSTEKKTMAPKPKEGFWDKIAMPQAGQAKKHVEGSTSTEKGTKAPKPKNGNWEEATSSAPEATEHIKDKKAKMSTDAKTGDWDGAKKKSIAESEIWEDDEFNGLSDDLEAMKISPDMSNTPMGEPEEDDDNAYDAGVEDDTFFKGDKTLDGGPDVEDRAEKLSVADIRKAEKPQPVVQTNTNDDDIDIQTVSDVDVKLLYSARSGQPSLVVRGVDGKGISSEEVPPQYLELAKKHPQIALQKIRAEKAAMVPAMDDELMELVRNDINEGLKKLRK